MVRNNKQYVWMMMILIAFVVSSCGDSDNSPTSPSSRTLVGSWDGIQNALGTVTFESNGRFFNSIGESGTYTVDFSKNPHHLNLTGTFAFDQGSGTILTIFEFEDNNTIRLERNAIGNPRPTGFSNWGRWRRM